MKPKHWQSPGLAAALEQASLARYEGTNELMDKQAVTREALAGQTKPETEGEEK